MKFQTMDGDITNESDPKRAVWYSLMCGYWTDDWTKLAKVGSGIPCCPVCHCPGCYGTIEEWFDGINEHDKNYPGYHEFITGIKEKCLGRKGGTEAMKKFAPTKPEQPHPQK